MDNSTVNLQISKDIVNPIIAAKVQEAILEALGGKDKLVENVINNILYDKVNDKGVKSSYSSDNKFTYLDVLVTQQIGLAVKQELENIIKEQSSVIKESLLKHIKTKAGSDKVAKALLDSFTGTFPNSWRSSIEIKFTEQKQN